MHKVFAPITVTYQPSELDFLFCGNCAQLVDPFNPKTQDDQHACDKGHLVCAACAAKDHQCKTCNADISAVIPVTDDPSHSPAYFMRKLTHACQSPLCTYATIDPYLFAYHAAFSCPYRQNATKTYTHVIATNEPPAGYTTINSLQTTIAISPTEQSHSLNFVVDMPHDNKLVARIRIDMHTHTLKPIMVSEHVAVILQNPHIVAFHLLVPGRTAPLQQHLPPLSTNLRITIVPLFKTPHPDPECWLQANTRFHACKHTIAHASKSFTAHFQHTIHHLWSPKTTPPVLEFQPVKPICIGVPPDTFAAFTDGIYFNMPATPENDAFLFKIKADDTTTAILVQCPACFAYMPFEPDFCEHIDMQASVIFANASRVSITIPHTSPCARLVWVSDLAHELTTPVIHNQLNLFPMLADIRSYIELDQELPIYYGMLLKICNQPKLLAISYNAERHIKCALCNQTDPLPSFQSIADHFKIPVAYVQQFSEIKFNTDYTQYAFIPSKQLPKP